MRIAVGQFQDLDDETLTYAKQLGVASVQLNTPTLAGDHRWEYQDLYTLRMKCEEHGLTLEALENVPLRFYDKIMLGLPGRDEQIEHYQKTIQNMGRAGIPILGYHFMPNFVWRTSFTTPGRGGAKVSSFDMKLVHSKANKVTYRMSEHKATCDATQMWENYEYFIKAVIPVAEEAGVRLALHPDDPPVEELDGVARLFYKPENFKRAMEIADSPAWGLDLCCGCCSEMPGGSDTLLEMIRFFGPKKKILYVHFRDVQGTVPKFQECFLGEGNYNPMQIISALQQSGFDGFLLDDHVPEIINDSPWGHRSRAHAIGYMQGLLNALEYIQN